jgi:hypothetical protein
MRVLGGDWGERKVKAVCYIEKKVDRGMVEHTPQMNL